jgi:hypothetical protein
MTGTILWWQADRTQGVIQVVDEHGIVFKFFLLGSRIIQRPEKIRSGHFVKFSDALQPKRQDLLPIAVNVVVSEHPFTDQASASSVEVRP